MKRLLLLTGSVIFLFLVPTTSFAAVYDICGYINFHDSRTRLSNLSGSRVKSPNLGMGDTQRAKRVKLYLFDEDGNCQDHESGCNQSDDDLLATTYSSGSTGYYCFNNIGEAEDVYIKVRYESDDTEVRDSSGALVSASTYTHLNFGYIGSNYNPDGGDMTLNFNISCPQTHDVNGQCYWTLSPEEELAAILQSAVDVDVLITDDTDFHPNGHNNRITFYYPDDPGSNCDGDDNRCFSCDGICISAPLNNHTVYHETGHALMRRMVNVCSGSLADGSCMGDGHSWTSWEGEKCATSEGWAHFVALATNFWPYEDQAWYQSTTSDWYAEGSTVAANSSPSRCVSISTNPHRREGNVARFFWDLYDTTSIFDTIPGYSDDASWSFSSILNTWDYFPNGTSNRKNKESGDNGRNAYDYAHYAPSAESELNVNCLNNQDN